MKPEIYVAPYYQDSYPITRFVNNLFFINELWFTSWRAFSNGPFWSLSYEFFYYIIFAITIYLRGVKRLVYVSLAAIIAGPKILLLLPTWLLGVLLFHMCKKSNLHLGIGVLLVLSSMCLYALYRLSGLPDYLYEFTQDTFGEKFVRSRLEFSRWFVNDYIVAILVSMNIFGVALCSAHIRIPKKLNYYIRYFAGMTFTLYLFHYPLLQLFGSIFNSISAVVFLTFASVALIAPLTEQRKSYWLKLVNRIHEQVRKL